jgi:hypothetical protein
VAVWLVVFSKLIFSPIIKKVSIIYQCIFDDISHYKMPTKQDHLKPVMKICNTIILVISTTKALVISTSPLLNQRPQKAKPNACNFRPSLKLAQMHEKQT